MMNAATLTQLKADNATALAGAQASLTELARQKSTNGYLREDTRLNALIKTVTAGKDALLRTKTSLEAVVPVEDAPEPEPETPEAA